MERPEDDSRQLFSLAETDSKIARGNWGDWAAIHRAVLADPAVLDQVEAVCFRFRDDPYAQRYHFWMRYVKERRAAS